MMAWATPAVRTTRIDVRHASLTTDELRARLAGAPPDPALFDSSELADPARALVPAAVLVGIATGPAPGVLLTRRTEHLRQHSGQVSFPGGRIDPEDASAEAAALREAREEVGLDPSHADIVGRLGDYATGTGYRITPVLALLTPGYATRASAEEVSHIFELPLDVLLDPAAPERRGALWRGAMREFWVWPHPEHYIWGATAAILVHLAARLRGDTPADAAPVR